MKIPITHRIHVPQALNEHTNWLEKTSDLLSSPAQLFLREYTLVKEPDGKLVLKSSEKFATLFSTLKKVAAIMLLPLTAIGLLLGYGLKSLAHKLQPSLKTKHSLETIVNARDGKNFAGKLPQNPWTPNCVNSQEKNFWGKLYDVEPIAIPSGLKDPMKHMKAAISKMDAILTEESTNYLHYAFTVVIPKGPLKGTYIDDVDIFYNRAKSCFEIRSASRVGFRDAGNLNFSLPGANKKRVEAIHKAFQDLTS